MAEHGGAAPSIRSPVRSSSRARSPAIVLEIEFLDIAPAAARVHGDHAGARLPARRRSPRRSWSTGSIARRLGDARPSCRACAFPARRSWASPGVAPSAAAGARVDGARERADGPRRHRLSARRRRARCPAAGRSPREGFSTLPPRENGGNFDVKQLTKGVEAAAAGRRSRARCSPTGDGHFAQGDGEVCVTAVEMGATRRRALPRPAGWAPRGARGPALLTHPATSRRRSGLRRSASSPPWACRSATTA